MAVVDRREIEFDAMAVKRAVEYSPHAAQAFGLPPLKPHSVRCDPASGSIEVSYGILTNTRVFGLRAEALGAILIAYCNRIGIPMPHRADKAIRIEHGHVVLVLVVRLDTAPQPEVPEGAVSHAPEAVQAWAWIVTPDC